VQHSIGPTAETADQSAILWLGNNLVKIAALTVTTLFGSNTTETLVLGERGSAGLVWCITSAFGALSVIKACTSGASSGWLRSLLGLRTIASDQAVGLDLKLSPKSNRVRATFAWLVCRGFAGRISSSRQLPVNYRRRIADPCRGTTPHVGPTMQIFDRLPKTFRGDPFSLRGCPTPIFPCPHHNHPVAGTRVVTAQVLGTLSPLEQRRTSPR